jgi:hypothetical protein
MNTKQILSLMPLLMVLSSQTTIVVAKNAIELSETEIMSLLNKKISKVQEGRNQETTPPQQQRRQQQIVAMPDVVTPVRRTRINSSSLPAWRKPASPTMTRSFDDALFAATKNRNINLLRQLVADGADVNHQNFNGETALHIAASIGNIQIVQYLIGQGANINARTGTQWMPIHHAMRFDRANVANYLISRNASLRQKTIDGFTALDFAKKSKNPQIQAIARKYGS